MSISTTGFEDGACWYPLEGSLPAALGDFYKEKEVTRSFTMHSGGGDFTSLVKADCEPYVVEGRDWQKIEQCDAKFIPVHNFFQLGPNTILVSSVSAGNLLDQLLAFLAEDASCVLLNVNRNKFSIKAQLCIDGLDCVAKAYIYKKCAGEYVVDMHRRNGNNIVFQRMYRWLSQRLLMDGLDHDALPSLRPVLQETPHADVDRLEEVLQTFKFIGQPCY
jgi:hypothetical protein